MPSYILIPLAAVAAAVLCGAALGPCVWLTRSTRALKVRGISGPMLIATCVVAAIPWGAVLLYVHYTQKLSFSANVHGVAQLLGVILIVLAVFAALVSLPLGAIVLSITWLLDRRVLLARNNVEI